MLHHIIPSVEAHPLGYWGWENRAEWCLCWKQKWRWDLSVSLDSGWAGVENWKCLFAPNCHSKEFLLSCMLTLTLKVKFVLADLMSLFAWTPKSGHKNLHCLWYSSLLLFECGALCGTAAGLDVERPCWIEANHSLVLLYSFHVDIYPAFCIPRTLMASTHVNHNIYITEVKTGKCVHSLVGHRRTPWCVTFHPTIPGLIASGCLDGEVRIWDLHVSLSWNSYTFCTWWVVDLFSLKLYPRCCLVRNLFGSFM